MESNKITLAPIGTVIRIDNSDIYIKYSEYNWMGV